MILPCRKISHTLWRTNIDCSNMDSSYEINYGINRCLLYRLLITPRGHLLDNSAPNTWFTSSSSGIHEKWRRRVNDSYSNPPLEIFCRTDMFCAPGPIIA
ncbi:hypothetical protein NPIL_178701 [Nephila pilipes]|uniref:Uncharacterized protein n=1 Tax=Nephila pilipes TaxID=299642 RepID=A0A8X6N4R6_NEPPI|nr:hypothetical protein NPIL_178701 [Nephila pilipes]